MPSRLAHQEITRLVVDALGPRLSPVVFDQAFLEALYESAGGCRGYDCDHPAYVVIERCKCGDRLCDYQACCGRLEELERQLHGCADRCSEEERGHIASEIARLRSLGVMKETEVVYCCSYGRRVVASSRGFRAACTRDRSGLCACKEHDGVNESLYWYYYDVAVRLYASGKRAEAARALGRAIHYAQDGVLARWMYTGTGECGGQVSGVDVHDRAEAGLERLLGTPGARELVEEGVARALSGGMVTAPGHDPRDILVRAAQNTAATLLRFQSEAPSTGTRLVALVAGMLASLLLLALSVILVPRATHPLPGFAAVASAVALAYFLAEARGRLFRYGVAGRRGVPPGRLVMGAVLRTEQCVSGMYREFYKAPRRATASRKPPG